MASKPPSKPHPPVRYSLIVCSSVRRAPLLFFFLPPSPSLPHAFLIQTHVVFFFQTKTSRMMCHYAGCIFNHSCTPNCDWHITSAGRFEVRAAAVIGKGESCTISFEGANLEHDTAARRATLKENHGFDCLCKRCAAATSTPSPSMPPPSGPPPPPTSFMDLARAAAPDLFTLLPDDFLQYLARVGVQHAALYPAVYGTRFS